MADVREVGGASETLPEETRLQSLASLCGSLVVGLFVLTFIAKNFLIPSASMASTLLVGDHVIVDRTSLSPATGWARFEPYRKLRRGEPVVFYKPVAEADGPQAGEHIVLVKRVIGLPGDRIHLRGGVVYLNGVAQDEPQAAKPTLANYDAYRDDFPALPGLGVRGVTAEWGVDLPQHLQGDDMVVPPDSYFMMGDNRTISLDSRYWGFVPRANLIGRPSFVYWSFVTPNGQDEAPLSEQARFTMHEIVHFFDESRWNRTLQVIR